MKYDIEKPSLSLFLNDLRYYLEDPDFVRQLRRLSPSKLYELRNFYQYCLDHGAWPFGDELVRLFDNVSQSDKH